VILAGMSENARTALDVVGLFFVLVAAVMAVFLLASLIWAVCACVWLIGTGMLAVSRLSKPAETPNEAKS
jgi:hypothetical protein